MIIDGRVIAAEINHTVAASVATLPTSPVLTVFTSVPNFETQKFLALKQRRAAEVGVAVGKKILPIQPWMARLAFWFFWHATRGKIPTCPGSWRFYSYPLVMSGAKLATVYQCKYTSKEAFAYTDGRYEEWVPKEKRHPKP